MLKLRAFMMCLAIAPACYNPAPSEREVEGSVASDLQPSAATVPANDVVRVGVEPGPRLRGTSCEQPAPCDGGSYAGNHAVMRELEVTWKDTEVFESGRGTLTVLSLGAWSDLCPGEGDGEVVQRVCDLRFPVLRTRDAKNAVQLSIPEAAWEQRDMPVHAASARVSEGGVNVDPSVATLGLNRLNPDGAWPDCDDTPFLECSHGNGEACFPDQDADGEPGLSLYVRRGTVPTNPNQIFTGGGAEKLHAAVRFKLGGVQPVGENCQGASSPAAPSDVDLRVFGCVHEGGYECGPAAAYFVDQHIPQFRARGEGDQQTVIRLGDLDTNVTCADVRALFAW